MLYLCVLNLNCSLEIAKRAVTIIGRRKVIYYSEIQRRIKCQDCFSLYFYINKQIEDSCGIDARRLPVSTTAGGFDSQQQKMDFLNFCFLNQLSSATQQAMYHKCMQKVVSSTYPSINWMKRDARKRKKKYINRSQIILEPIYIFPLLARRLKHNNGSRKLKLGFCWGG